MEEEKVINKLKNILREAGNSNIIWKSEIEEIVDEYENRKRQI